MRPLTLSLHDVIYHVPAVFSLSAGTALSQSRWLGRREKTPDTGVDQEETTVTCFVQGDQKRQQSLTLIKKRQQSLCSGRPEETTVTDIAQEKTPVTTAGAHRGRHPI